MNSYEHTFIAKQDLSDSQIKKLIEKYENIINNNQGKILKAENWGLRNLSYEIRKNKKGIYYHIKFQGLGETIQKLEENENIDESIIRFLTIRVKKIDLDTNYFGKKEDQKITEKNEKK
jgi:small subunit ribosomal protein S6